MNTAGWELRVAQSLTTSVRKELLEFPVALKYPFLHPDWLRAFETSQTVLGRSGWIPRHLTLYRGGQLAAFVPGYIKLHSFGEFVFDQSWAQCSESQLGVPYYPKFLVGVPFTPATAPRFLFHPELSLEERDVGVDLIAQALIEFAQTLNLSSVHILFCDDDLGRRLEELGWITRLGIQYQFHNPGFDDFEQFLASLRAKRRANIRRERREVAERGLSIEIRNGSRLSAADARLAYELYLTTVDKYVWGRRYLNQAFFDAVMHDLADQVHLVLAKDSTDRVVAGAFNLLGQEALYGRYWGTFVEEPFLHFEVCLYSGVQHTIERRLRRFEAGAGGEHKHGRGLTPTLTRSAHFIVDQRLSAVISDFCQREAAQIQVLAEQD
jgi:predicted N-acyltransferase